MADQSALSSLQDTSNQIDSVDLARLLRKNLGEESLELAFEPRWQRILHVRDFSLKYAPTVHNEQVNQVRSHLQQIAALMKAQSERSPSDYINQKVEFLRQIDNLLEETRRSDAAFVSAAIAQRGFLEDEGVRREYERTVEQLRAETAATLTAVKQEADRAIQDAKALADQIEERARRTATHISIAAAQEQFLAASADLDSKVKRWGRVLAVAVGLLVLSPFAFMKWSLPESNLWPVHLYHALLRLLVLSALAAFASFAAKMLRAHLHLAEKNRHRVRVANSAESFVNSALDPQQRDLILAKLVDAIVDFGESGLIKQEPDDMGSPATTGDVLGRILVALKR